MKTMHIPLHKPWIGGEEIRAVTLALEEGSLAGGGRFGQRLSFELERYLGGSCSVLLTPSATAALELAALVLNLGPGDEVIMPSFAFSSCANAIMLRGAKPVFVEIEESTGNIDVEAVERAITQATRAVMMVHYGGWACAVDEMRAILSPCSVALIEDAAHALGARYKGQCLGTLGDCAAFSFHATKNLTCGEGGCFVAPGGELLKKAGIMREKGTNRQAFLRGEVDEYTWVALGSSFLLADVLAVIVLEQLRKIESINEGRWRVAEFYRQAFSDLVEQGKIVLPAILPECRPNWHIFWIRVSPLKRDRMIVKLREKGIEASFHFVPLHLSPMGEALGYKKGDLPVTERFAASLIRLPIYPQLTQDELEYVFEAVRELVLSV